VRAGRDEDDYFQSNLFTVARRRVVWLLVLLVANKPGTSAVIRLERRGCCRSGATAALSAVIGTGRNVGAQELHGW